MSEPRNHDTGLQKAATRGVGWSAVEAFGAQLIRVLTLIVLARMLGPEAFGLVAMSMAVIALSNILIGMGLDSALIQKKDVDDGQINAAFWTSTGVSAVLACTVYALAPLAATLYSEPRVVEIVRWLSVVVAVRGIGSILVAIIQKSLNFAALAKRRLLAETLAAGIALAAVLNGAGVYGLIAQHISLAIFETALVWWLCPWKPGRFALRGISQLFRSGSVISATKVVDYVNAQSPYIIVGAVLGAETLGLFSVARRIMEMIRTTVYTLIHRVSFPVLSAAQNNAPQFQQILYAATAATALLVFPTFATTFMLAEQFVSAVLGQHWLASVPLVEVLSLVGAASCVMMLHPLALMAKGRFQWRLRLTVGRALLGLPLFLIAAPAGALSVAWALLARNLSLDPFTLYLSRRASGLSLIRLAKSLAAPIAGTLCLAACVWLTLPHTETLAPGNKLINLILPAATGAAAYVIAILSLWAVTRQPPIPGLSVSQLGEQLPGSPTAPKR